MCLGLMVAVRVMLLPDFTWLADDVRLVRVAPSQLAADRIRILGFAPSWTEGIRTSVIRTPVALSAASTTATDAFGNRDLISAQAPATCGAAIEVPLRYSKVLPGIEE